MSSSQWNSLILKRDISRLRSGFTKKRLFSSALSQKSTFSSPLPFHVVDYPSRPSSPATEPVSSSRFLNTELLDLDSGNSSTSSESSKDFVEERRTLVPIAPFLCGHAHTFSAFAPKKVKREEISKPGNQFSEADYQVHSSDFESVESLKQKSLSVPQSTESISEFSHINNSVNPQTK